MKDEKQKEAGGHAKGGFRRVLNWRSKALNWRGKALNWRARCSTVSAAAPIGTGVAEPGRMVRQGLMAVGWHANCWRGRLGTVKVEGGLGLQ